MDDIEIEVKGDPKQIQKLANLVGIDLFILELRPGTMLADDTDLEAKITFRVLERDYHERDL